VSRPAWMDEPFRDDGTPRDPRWRTLVVLPTDYDGYGGAVVRWERPDEPYPDCSCGCVWFDATHDDWGTCRRPGAPREGLLTWEHQAGKQCFEAIEDLAARVRRLEAAARDAGRDAVAYQVYAQPKGNEQAREHVTAAKDNTEAEDFVRYLSDTLPDGWEPRSVRGVRDPDAPTFALSRLRERPNEPREGA
jgi:hypothetical protein